MMEAEWNASVDPQAMLAWLRVMPGLPVGYPGDRKLRLFACACYRLTFHSAADRQHAEDGEAIADGDKPSSKKQTWLTVPTGLEAAAWAIEKADAVLPQQMCDLMRETIGNPYRPIMLPRPKIECPDCHGKGSVREQVIYNTRYDRVECGRCDCSGKIDGPCPWITPTVLSLATAAYEERPGRKCEACEGDGYELFRSKGPKCPVCHGTGRIEDGTLDAVRLAVLADGIEEAGCPVETDCVKCEGSGVIQTDGPNYLLESNCQYCGGSGKYPDGKRGSGKVPNPLLAHLRSPGPHVRGCHAVDIVLGKE